MDPQRFRDVYQRIRELDELSTHRIRPRTHGLHRATLEEIEKRGNEIALYSIELREIVEELMEAIAAKPQS